MRSSLNLEKWQKTHLLPLSFPDIKQEAGKLANESLFLRENGREVDRIMAAIQGSARTMAIFPPGQGASTILGEVIRRARTSSVRVQGLFVVLDPVACCEADDFREEMEKRIREAIFEQLLMGYWDEAFYGTRKQKLFQLFNAPNDAPLIDLRYQLQSGDLATVQQGREKLTKLADAYADRLAELYATLYTQVGLSTTLIMDFPYRADEDVVSTAFREIKWFDENDKGADFPVAALSEAYFVTREQADTAYNVWQRDYNTVEFPPYNEAEVFAILAAHFRPKSGGREVPLGAVFSQEFVKCAWAEGRPLEEMIDAIRKDMLHALDIDPGRIQYMLTPRV